MADKLVISDVAFPLWKTLLLNGSEPANQQELLRMHGQAYNQLAELKLVTSEPDPVKGAPSYIIKLGHGNSRLSELEKDALRLMKGQGKSWEDFKAWANQYDVPEPTAFLDRLLYLDLVKLHVPGPGKIQISLYISR